MPSVNFDLSDIKPLLSTLGLGQAPPPPTPINNRPIQPLQLPPTPAAAGFTEWAGDPKNQQPVADAIVAPGTPLLSGASTASQPPLGSNVPLDSRFNIMPPQRAPMAFLNPPQAPGTTAASPQTSVPPYQGSIPTPGSPSQYSSLFSGDDKPGTPTQRAFPGPITAASGLHDKLVAANITAPNPLFPRPRPFLVPPTSNPSPFNPSTPPPAMPQLPQAASGQFNMSDPVKLLPSYATAQLTTMAAVQPPPTNSGITPPPTGTPTAPAARGQTQLLPYQNRLQADQAELQRQQTTGSGVSQIKNPILRTLARIGDACRLNRRSRHRYGDSRHHIPP